MSNRERVNPLYRIGAKLAPFGMALAAYNSVHAVVEAVEYDTQREVYEIYDETARDLQYGVPEGSKWILGDGPNASVAEILDGADAEATPYNYDYLYEPYSRAFEKKDASINQAVDDIENTVVFAGMALVGVIARKERDRQARQIAQAEKPEEK